MRSGWKWARAAKKSNEKRRWIIQRTTVVDDEEEKTIQLQILFDPIVSSLTHGLCLTLSFIRSLVSWSDEPLVCVVEQCWKRNSVCCCRCWLLVFLLIQLFGFSLLFLTLLYHHVHPIYVLLWWIVFQPFFSTSFKEDRVSLVFSLSLMFCMWRR